MPAKHFLCVAAATALFLTAACSDSSGPGPQPAPVAVVQIDPAAAALSIGETKQLGAIVKDGSGNVLTGRAVQWTSTDTTVATVSSSGVVTAVAVGNALIKAKSEGREGAAQIAVAAVQEPVASVEIVTPGDTIEAWDAVALVAVARDAGGAPLLDRSITWSSSDPSIATVNPTTGVVTGVDRGTVTITATSEGRSDTTTRIVVIRYRSISAGASHACNIASGGIAWCWGLNGRDGRVGSATMVDGEHVTTPHRVPGDHRFVQLATYSRTTCGLTAEGRIWCWGTNAWGALGIGATTPQQSSVPVQVAGGHTYKQVAAGGGHMCGLTTAGKAYCWGANGTGELGNGTRTFSAQPVAGATNLTFVSVAPGSEYTCGLTAANEAWCWGYDGMGNLGDGRPISNGNTDTLTPVKVVGGHAFAQITAGYYTSCGVTAAGQAYCWGRNNGKFGNGATANSSVPVATSGGHAFRSIAAGYGHTCAITTADVVYCWGGNGNGQLGVAGMVNGSNTPVRAGGDLLAAEVSAANIGTGSANFTCVISNDRLRTYCWGRNDFGQLGNGTTAAAVAANPAPAFVIGQKPL